MEWNANGVTCVLQGSLGLFDFQTLFINLVVASGMLSVSVVMVDLIMQVRASKLYVYLSHAPGDAAPHAFATVAVAKNLENARHPPPLSPFPG